MLAGVVDLARCATGGPGAGFCSPGGPLGYAESTGPVMRAAMVYCTPVDLNPSRRTAGSMSALKRCAGRGSALVELCSKGSKVVLAPACGASAPTVERLMDSREAVTTSFWFISP